MDKDKTLCASGTGRDNIPELEKSGDRRAETYVVRLQRIELEGLGKTCLTGTTGLQTLGECYGWSEGGFGVTI